MSTQTEISDTIHRSGFGSYDSAKLNRDISKSDYASQALDLWSQSQTPLYIEPFHTNRIEGDIAYIHEDIINLREKYQWLTCYVWLPEEYNILEIDPDTILLNDRITAARVDVKDKLQLLIAKFSWSKVKEILKPGEFLFTISGQLFNGILFNNSDNAIVIDEEKSE